MSEPKKDMPPVNLCRSCKELELTPAPAKRSRDEAIALKHLTRQRDKLIARRAAITKTIEKLDASILPLE
jgi:hypothetical protein